MAKSSPSQKKIIYKENIHTESNEKNIQSTFVELEKQTVFREKRYTGKKCTSEGKKKKNDVCDSRNALTSWGKKNQNYLSSKPHFFLKILPH